MIRKLLIILLVAVTCSQVVTSRKKHHQVEKNSHSQYFSVFTKYEDIRGDIRRQDLRETICKNVRLWILHRHGTRLPLVPEIKDLESLLTLKHAIVNNHKKGRGELSKQQLESIESWTFNSSIIETAGHLTLSGFDETHRIAARLKQTFPELLDVKYSNDTFYFRHSNTQRTANTAYSFIDELFGKGAHEYADIVKMPKNEDILLYPSEACGKLYILTKDIRKLFERSLNFTKTDDYINALKSLSSHLGFKEALGYRNLTAIFSACAYDSAWFQANTTAGVWCAALNEKSREVGEYFYDLALSKLSGYSNKIAERAYCAAPQDLWETFSSAVEDLDMPYKNEAVVAHFTHDYVIMGMHTTLGLLKDYPPMTPYNFAQQHHRKWRSSEVVPFASNIVAVLQQCETPDKISNFEVMLFRNEKPWTDVPLCPGGICSWSNFKRFFKPVADECKFEEFC